MYGIEIVSVAALFICYLKSGRLLLSYADVFDMWNKHFRYVASVALIVLAIALVVAAIALVYVLVKPESFFITFSNFLFLAGAFVLTVGAFFEFFLRTSSPQIGHSLLTLCGYVIRRAGFKEIDKDIAEKSEYGPSGGWMLIYAGALAIAISFLFAFIGMK